MSAQSTRQVGRTHAARFDQRPTKRKLARKGKPKTKAAFDWHSEAASLRAALPFLAKVVFIGLIVVLCLAAYRTAATAEIFNLRRANVEGVHRASLLRIERHIKNAHGSTNVWQADLDALRNEIEREPYVKSVVVSRVLPSDLRVRVSEREPRAVVRLSDGRLVWADEEGVTLAAVSPSEVMPEFFLRGWDESETKEAAKENSKRVATYLQLLSEWRANRTAARISEVNLDDLTDVRAQLSGRDAMVEVRLGGENFNARLARALDELEDARKSERAMRGEQVIRINALDDKRITVGFAKG